MSEALAIWRDPDGHPIPGHMRQSLFDYIEMGTPPGGFLRAVLINDLREACARADPINRHRLFTYVCFLYNKAPSSCWGSEERVQTWINIHAAQREAAKQ